MKVNNANIGKGLGSIDQTKSNSLDKVSLSKNKAADATDKELGSSSKLNLSDRAQMMAKAKKIASETDAVDEARVAQLQKLIDEGKYNVDAAAVADRLVDQHLVIPD